MPFLVLVVVVLLRPSTEWLMPVSEGNHLYSDYLVKC